MSPDPDVIVLSVAAQRMAIVLLIVGLVGLVIYAIDVTVTRDPGPPPRGKSYD